MKAALIKSVLPDERIQQIILYIRSEKVILDTDLAALYGVTAKRLNQTVKRNIARFPIDFMFQLTKEEADFVFRSRSQIVTLKRGRNVKYLPYAFTEQGVAMLSGLLNSPRAIQVNVEIMRAFVRLRQMLSSHADLARKIENLEKKYDIQFRQVFDAIRELMTPPEPKRNPMGFRPIKIKK